MGKQAKERKKPSLGLELVGIVLVCWILPVAIIATVAGYFTSNNINRQIVSTITSSVDSAIKASRSKVEAAVAGSRNASYNPAVKQACYRYAENKDKELLYDSLTGFLVQQYKYDDNFLAAMLFCCDEPDTLYYTYNDGYAASYSNVRVYEEQAHGAAKQIAANLGTEIQFLNKNGRVYMVRNLVDSNQAFEPFAVLVLELNTQVMFGGVENVLWKTGANIWLDNTPVALAGGASTMAGLDVLRGAPESGLYEGENDYTAYGVQQISDTQFAHIVTVDKLTLMQQLMGFRTVFFWVVALVVPLLGLAAYFFYSNVSRPVLGLMDGTRHIEQGELGYQITMQCGNREFQHLTDSFNDMSERLKYQFERIYSEELALRDAKIMAMQSQINPHFLNNTLEIINWEARLADNIKVSRMIEALSTMLDAAMDRKGKQLVRLSEEMMYVDAYLYIISERLGKRLTVQKEIDETLLSCEVPRLVMQPILENAVEHGVQRCQQGSIAIRVYTGEDGALILEVENDGEMTQADEEQIARLLAPDYDARGESANSLGICNVNQRVRMIFGANSGLFITKNANGNAVARIVIPVPTT